MWVHSTWAWAGNSKVNIVTWMSVTNSSVETLPEWDLLPFLGSGATGSASTGSAASTEDPRAAVVELLDRAEAQATALDSWRGRVGTASTGDLETLMRAVASVTELIERAQSYAHLDYSTATSDAAKGSLVALVDERIAGISNRLVFVALEWAAADDAHAKAVLADPRLQFCAHHLEVSRLTKPYLLSEGEEKILSEKSVTGTSAWTRLFDETLSALTIDLDGDGQTVTLDAAFSRLYVADRDVRKNAAASITDALQPGLRTRSFIYNTLLADKSTDDRLRGYPSWVSSRNLSNQASDDSVRALIEAVTRRYSIAQRWYRIKTGLLGVGRLADYDRYAALPNVGNDGSLISWSEAVDLVLDAYGSFSSELGSSAKAFFDERRVHAADTPGKRGGAYCSPAVPELRPYVFLNWSGTRRDVLTLAHELGHGVHFDLGRRQGIFHTMTPLTVAETASVFGEEVTFGRLVAMEPDARARLSLLGEHVEGHIATVFRQVAMWCFEDRAHTARRTSGEVSVESFNEMWVATQQELFGDVVEITPGYASWWSYIPHFMHVPGYVYAYAFGQLLALSVYQRSLDEGPDFADRYLGLLAAGGSEGPEQLAARVGCDLSDPGFWDSGLDLVERAVTDAEAAAAAI
jgi:oligoendopeptidase F